SFGPGGDLLRDDLPSRHHPEDRHRPGDDCVGAGRLMVVASAWWSEIAIGRIAVAPASNPRTKIQSSCMPSASWVATCPVIADWKPLPCMKRSRPSRCWLENGIG